MSLIKAVDEILNQEAKGKPGCCSAYPGTIEWNRFNQVVQCHRCGQQWAPIVRSELKKMALALKEVDSILDRPLDWKLKKQAFLGWAAKWYSQFSTI